MIVYVKMYFRLFCMELLTFYHQTFPSYTSGRGRRVIGDWHLLLHAYQMIPTTRIHNAVNGIHRPNAAMASLGVVGVAGVGGIAVVGAVLTSLVVVVAIVDVISTTVSVAMMTVSAVPSLVVVSITWSSWLLRAAYSLLRP